MAKFRGLIGYAVGTVEKPADSGIFVENVVERPYRGTETRTARNLEESAGSINQNVTVENTISIIADPYAREHFHAIRYVKWAGAAWTVESVTVQRPRLLLRLGGVYDGQTAPAAAEPAEDADA